MIDLHLHTSASDGLLSPGDLVDRIAAAGVTVCSVTDHDTVDGLEAAAAAAARRGLRFLPGIEITAVAEGRDLHVLGYGFDPASAPLATFLVAQREERRRRVQRLFDRLAELDMPVDRDAVLEAAKGRVIGRPHVARAMVAAGYVASVTEAFERWLGSGQPAFVPRSGASPEQVVALLHGAGGVVSMAHPGVTQRDALIPGFAAAGLDAIEVWHSDHDDRATAHYGALAVEHGLLMTGGSDFHGDLADRVCRLGEVGPSREAFEALLARLADRRAAAPAPTPAPATRTP